MIEFDALSRGSSASAVHDPLYLGSDWLEARPGSILPNRHILPLSESAARLDALMTEILEDDETPFDGTFRQQRSPITPTIPLMSFSAGALPQLQGPET